VGVLQDVEPDRADLVATLEMVANTTKPLVLLVSEPAQFSSVLDLLQSLCGRLSTRPFAIPYVNPVTPLVLNEGTTDKMFVTAERGLPLIFSSYGMAGTSAPITPVGSLELLNAELLAGLTLSQLINQGTPVILGILPMAFDMREMLPLFDASTFLLNVACAEMMSFYGLPHAGTSGSGEGWGADLLASGTMWANHLTSVLGRVDLCPFIGSSFGSKAFSPHAAVYADEVIAQVRRLARGFDLSEDAAPLAEVKEAGPGGDFLASDQTFQHFRDAYFHSDIFPTLDLEVWREKGSPQAAHFVRRRTRELMDQPVVPDDYAGLIESGARFIDLI
jgi:trimethylamine--corrinoid protein Co-methyltransferase